MFKFQDDYGDLQISSYSLKKPSLIQDNRVELELILKGEGWLRVLIKPIKKTYPITQFFKYKYVSFVSSSKFLAKFFLSNYRLETQLADQVYFQTPYETIIYHKIRKVKTLKIDVPTLSDVIITTLGVIGIGRQNTFIYVDQTPQLHFELDDLFCSKLKLYDSNDFKTFLDTNFKLINHSVNFSEDFFSKANEVLIKKYETSIKTNPIAEFYDHTRRHIYELVEIIYSKKTNKLSKIIQIPHANLSNVDNKWGELKTIIFEKH